MDLAKLKVVELRAQLSQRGLDTKGKKELLVERLRAALDEENATREQGKEPSAENNATQKENSERPSDVGKQPPKTPGRASRSSSMTTPTKISTRSGPRTPNSMRQPSPIKTQRLEVVCEVLPTIAETTPVEKEMEPTVKSPEKTEERQTRGQTKALNEVHPSPEKSPAEAEPSKVAEDPRVTSEVNETDSAEPVKVDEGVNVKESMHEEEKETREPSELKEENAELKEEAVELKEEAAESKEEPVESKEEPAESKEEPVESKEEATESKEEAAESKEEPAEEKMEVRDYEDNKEDPQNDEPMEEQVSEKVDDKPEESKETADDTEEEKKETENEEHIKEDDKDMDSGDHKEDKSVSLPETEAQDNSKMETDDVNDKPEVEIKEPAKEETAEPAETKELADEAEQESKKEDEEQDVEMAETNEEAKDQDEAKQEIKYQEDKGEQNGRKRKRSPSPGEASSPVQAPQEDEPPIDETSLTLSWYDSDLNLVIDKDGLFTATPMHTGVFSQMWAGARCSYGFLNGRVYYEARISENCRVNTNDVQNPHMLRIGWSATYTSMQLGEDRLSFGYDNTGRKCTAGEFTDYGRGFDQGDVIGCYLDATSPDKVTLAYTLNGTELGTAFEVTKEELDGKPLFPHILSKNCSLACNFGQEKPWSDEILQDYVSIGKADPEYKVAGPRRLERKEDCEVIMMCGLPGSGKTTWANRYAADNPQKLYNVLGIENLIQKTKHMSLPTRETYTGSWDLLIERCTRALNKLLELAATRRRNYILDQKNIYPSAQRRKMKSFAGYQRKAVVIVPTDEEYKARAAKRRQVEGKALPDAELMGMKANFSPPMVGDHFEAVDWVELGEVEARELIEKYNREGKQAGYGWHQPAKRARVDKSSTEGGREAGREPRNNRDNRDNRDHRRNNYQDRNRNPMWRGGGGGGSMGRWDRQGQRGGHGRHGGYGHQSMPWRARAPPIPPPHRGGMDRRGGGGGNDRRPNDRNRSSGPRQGGWGMSGYQGSQQGTWGQQQGSWSSGQQSSGGWGQQQSWGGQQWGGGSWKGYGQGSSSYGQSGYNQGYGNGNWNSWNQQYYNQYWGQQQQQQQQQATTGQTAATAGGGQAACTTENVTNDSTGELATSYSYNQE